MERKSGRRAFLDYYHDAGVNRLVDAKTQMSWVTKKVLILGLGSTGLSVARWLKTQRADITVYDTRDAPPHATTLDLEMPGTRTTTFPLQELPRFDIVVTSPGIALSSPLVVEARKLGIPIVGDIELFAQRLTQSSRAKVIAITGSNGKSTVTAMVGQMCQSAGLKTVVAGNIGLPVLDALMQNTEDPDVYVLELSSFQLETTYSLNADAATVLNISEDHLDRYASIEQYAAAKARIFEGSGVQVINRQDAYSLSMVRAQRQVFSFGLDRARSEDEWGIEKSSGIPWLTRGSEMLIQARELSVSGNHNIMNALAALALCGGLGLGGPAVITGLRSFKGLSHRVQYVATIGGVMFYDDSKGTNVGATVAALQGLPQKVVLIAGGEGKGQDFSLLQEAVRTNARAVILIGRDATLIADALKNAQVPIFMAEDLKEAVVISAEQAKSGDAVLLSPACASFDMFRDYEHRALVFIEAVAELGRAVVQ